MYYTNRSTSFMMYGRTSSSLARFMRVAFFCCR